MSGTEVKFFLSCDISHPLRFKLETLHGPLSSANPSTGDILEPLPDDPLYDTWHPTPEFYAECAIYIDGVPFGLSSRTRNAALATNCRWDEWVTMGVKYCDLTVDAQLALTIWDEAQPRHEVAFGACTLPLFTRNMQLKCGHFKLRLWPGKVADGSLPSSTPGKLPKHQRGEVERLEKLQNKYDCGEVARADWLDRLAFKAMDQIIEEENNKNGSRYLQLTIELPSFDHPVVFQEPGAHAVVQTPLGPSNELVRIWDPEVVQSHNPAEQKQLKLARMLSRTVIDRDLKPNSKERKDIANILQRPWTDYVETCDWQLLWRFRFSLTADRRALTKFLRCVDWSDAQDAKQAIELMYKWAPIDSADALELLSPAFTSEEVRAYAVSVLGRADDEELQCYLLQLVQALRYERTDFSKLAVFLVGRGAANFELGCLLHWYLLVELQDQAYAARYSVTHHSFVQRLIERKPEGEIMYDALRRQIGLAAQLGIITSELKSIRGSANKKVERLRQMLGLNSGMAELFNQENPLPLPLNPRTKVVGVIPEESTVFKSALSPLRITFLTETGEKCSVIYKKGDDLRQDQLIIQMVSLMDRLLKKENLDLRLTPYRVLATGTSDGILEFVPSMPLAQVLAERTIVRYLARHHPDPHGPFGLTADCLDTFVKSCAGYCVIMYILGVGDRHLDNLLLCEDGRLFHIDFGFILGRDPKPFPPPMKLCKEMVEAMGGAESLHYGRFKSYCCEAFNILRKSSNLILNLFHLMAGANIPDIASDSQKGISKLRSKFRLDLDDEAAVQYFQSLINESVSALFPQMVETIHRWAQYWR